MQVAQPDILVTDHASLQVLCINVVAAQWAGGTCQ